jgi:hypothetical protein
LKARPEPPSKRGAGTSLLAVAVSVIAVATLVPLEATESLPTLCIICGPLGGVDFVLNVLLFLPIGIAVAMMGGRVKMAVVVGGILTLAVESLQWRVIAGRDASLGDLLANTLGSAVGAWLATWAWRWLRTTGADALRLSAIWALVASAVIATSAMLLVPAIPPWLMYVQWTPVRPGTVPFTGRLLTAELNGRPLQAMEWLRVGWIPESVSTRLVLRASLEPPTTTDSRRAVVLRVANSLVETLMLAQIGEHLVFRSHALSSRFKFRSPVVGLTAAFAETDSRPNGIVMLEAISNRRAITVRSLQRNDDKEVTVPRTVGLGWVLIAPRDFAITKPWWVVNALWLGVLVFPVGFLTRRSGHTDRGETKSVVRWLPASWIAVAAAAATAVVGLSAPGAGDVFGLVAGCAGGWWTERFFSPGHLTNPSHQTVERIKS